VNISVKQFRLISLLEGLSFILLLFVAMPLKYIWELPQMVQIVGMAHGILFIVYIIAAYFLGETLNWSRKTLLIVWVCSILPFGPFYMERKYLK